MGLPTLAVISNTSANPGPFVSPAGAGVVYVDANGYPASSPDLLLPFFKFAAYAADDSDIPVDGTVRHQAIWNLTNNHKFVNAGTIAVPDWRQM